MNKEWEEIGIRRGRKIKKVKMSKYELKEVKETISNPQEGR